jgi:hypothetical protein
MADQLQLRGGTTAQTATFTGALREVTVDTDKDTLVVHDNALAGGYPLLRQDLSNLPAGTIDNADINASAAIVDTKLDTIATAGKVSNSATTATDANTASAIVARDASGNFTAGTITAALTGAASSNVLKAGDTMTGALVVPLASAATPSITFTGDLNTGIYSPGADQVAVATNGTGRLAIDASGNLIQYSETTLERQHRQLASSAFTATNIKSVIDGAGGYLTFETNTNWTNGNAVERLRITPAGLVGIGVSSPIESLSTLGNVSIGNNNASNPFSYLSFDASQYGAAQIRPLNDGAHLVGLAFYTDSSANAAKDPTEKVRITSGGSVGIGTASPGEKLTVVGSDNSANFRVKGSSSSGDFFIYNNASTNQVSLSTEGTSTDMAFAIGGYEAMKIDTGKRLLVGTSSSSEVNTAVFQGNSAAGSAANVTISNSLSNPTSTQTLGVLSFSDNSHVKAAQIECLRDGGTWTSGTSQPSALKFSTTADGASSPTERMRIDSAGNVTFRSGTTANTSGDGTVFLDSSGSGSPVYLYFKKTFSGTRDAIDFRHNGTSVGQIQFTNTATAYNTSSDYRLKENVVEITDGITRLQQLKPSRFNFIADPDSTVDGFIAHEVQDVVPEAISGEKDAVDDEGNPKYQGIDQSKLVPLLTAALQEAVAEIKALKDRVTALESA